MSGTSEHSVLEDGSIGLGSMSGISEHSVLEGVFRGLGSMSDISEHCCIQGVGVNVRHLGALCVGQCCWIVLRESLLEPGG